MTHTHSKMPCIVVEDDRVLRQVQVLIDPRATTERTQAYAQYVTHDVPDYFGWRETLRARLPQLFPADVRLVDSQESLRANLPEANVVIVEGLEIGLQELALAPHLAVVQNFGMVAENIDARACAQHGIPLLTLRRRTNIALAEHTLMFMLCLARRFGLVSGLVTTERLVASAIPQSPYDTRHTAQANFGRVPQLQTLSGRTLGLLGFGEIGRETAALARAFGMDVAYHKRTRLDAGTEHDLGVRYCRFDELFKQSDFLSIHIPMSAKTQGLIDAKVLGQMKQGSFLVNTARAGIVHQKALLDALASGHLAGAALDVLYQEPMAEGDSLLDRPNVLLTPHMAGASRINGLQDATDMLLGIQQALNAA